MTTIVLADDHAIFREGLKSLLAGVPGYDVVAEAGDGPGALELLAAHAPDMLIVDLSLPGIDGLEVTRRARKVSPDTRIIVLSMHASDEYVVRAIRDGALGYVLKSESMEDLATAIERALAGRRFLSAALNLNLEEILKRSEPGVVLDPYDTLTEREREILQLVAEGFTSPGIADRLFISLQTVNKHRANLMDKLDRHSQTELVHYALQRGLIQIDSISRSRESGSPDPED